MGRDEIGGPLVAAPVVAPAERHRKAIEKIIAGGREDVADGTARLRLFASQEPAIAEARQAIRQRPRCKSNVSLELAPALDTVENRFSHNQPRPGVSDRLDDGTRRVEVDADRLGAGHGSLRMVTCIKVAYEAFWYPNASYFQMERSVP